MINFFDLEQSISAEDIDKLESLIGYKLPKDYINHLMKYNGGRCEPNIFQFIENGNKTSSSLDWFLAIYDGEYDNLIKDVHTLKIQNKRMPSHILPIAHDPLGNFICISCGLQDNGYIYFWDHEKEVDYRLKSDNDYSNLYLIAKTFNDFLDGLEG